MFHENLDMYLKGEVKIYAIAPGKARKLIYEDHNAIVANAKKILVHAAGGDPFIIDTIEVYKATVKIAEDTLLQVEYPSGDKSVKFFATFDEASFSATLDEIRLVSQNGGLFSQITGLSHTKDNLTQLQIEWKITINNL